MRYLVFLILAAIIIVWAVQRTHDDKKADDAEKKESLHDQIHETTDYLTGKTPINAMIQSQWQIRRVAIQQAVRNFEIMNGRPPNSFEELIQENFIGQEQTYMTYGNVKSKLISGLNENGRFFVQWIGMDRKAGTGDDRIEQF
jgi:hypothetical protein